jgi:sugar phosphate isomerase/epimerase
VPASKVSIQLWTFAGYFGFGTDEAAQAKHEEVLRRLSEMGYRNVEPFTLSGWSAEEYAALLKEYGLKASARHVNVGTPTAPADIEQILEDNRTLGSRTSAQEGRRTWPPRPSGSPTPSTSTRSASKRARSARRSWCTTTAGSSPTSSATGPPTASSCSTPTRGTSCSSSTSTGRPSAARPVELVEQYGNRIRLFHVKDLNPTMSNRIEIVGRGSIDFPEIFATGGGSTRYFVVEHDPRFTDPSFDPFVAAQEGFAYLDCVTY